MSVVLLHNSCFMMKIQIEVVKKKQNMSNLSGVLNQMVVKARGELFRIHFCKGIDSGPSIIIGLDSSKTKNGNKYYCLFPIIIN